MRPLLGAVLLALSSGLSGWAAASDSATQASDLTDLKAALRQAATLEARGQVQVLVNFPPRQPPTRVTSKLPALPFRPALLEKNFNVFASGTEQVAGRPARRYDLTPRQGQAAHWTLWIDQTWNVPLAFAEYGSGGTLARQAVFQQVNPRPVKVAAQTTTQPAAPRPGLAVSVRAALPGLALPAGFMPVKLEQAGARWEITLSDGANTLALVLAPRDVKAAPGVASRQVGGRWLWLVGNLPDAALAQAIARVRLLDAAPLQAVLAASNTSPTP